MESFPNEQTIEDTIENINEDRRRGNPAETANHEIQKRILDAFEVFDHEHNNTVDLREIGTIIRSLGFCPSEGELQEIVREMEDPQANGYVHIDRFSPVMAKILQEQRFPSADADILLKAFEILDKGNKGFLTADEIRFYFTQSGEIFSPEEMEEFLNAALDPNTKNLNYRSFLHYLTINDEA